MDRQQRLDLQDLRRYAEARNQEQLQYVLKRLLQRMDYYVALAVPLECIRTFLPAFEGKYPEETWVRQLLLMINNYGKAPENDIAEMALQHDYSMPGAGNFLKAVYDLTQAMQDRHTPEARIGFMASAVVNGVMADLVHKWYRSREKAWERVRQDKSDEQSRKIAYVFWTHPETETRDREQWLSIADSIETKITRLESVQ